MQEKNCEHIPSPDQILVDHDGVCVDCIEMGSTWVHLRTCQTCGLTRCCDSSPQRHATKHYHASKHPVVRSAEQGEDWMWCYADDLFVPGEEE